jgi:hypothetical protein
LIHSNIEDRKELKKLIPADIFSHSLLIKIVSKIMEDELIETSKLIEYFPDKIERELLSKLLIDDKNSVSSEQIVIDCLRTLKSVPIKNKINKLRDIIQSKELSGQNPGEELKEIMRLQNKLSGDIE